MAVAPAQGSPSIAPDRLVFRGRDGLLRLRGAWIVTADDPDAFHAEVLRVTAGEVDTETVIAGPHAARRGPEQIAEHPSDVVTLTYLASGRMTVTERGTTFEAGAGDLLQFRTAVPIRFVLTERGVFARVSVPLRRVPVHLRAGAELPPGPLPRTRLVKALVALAEVLLAGPPSRTQAEAEHLNRALGQLVIAILAEAVGDVAEDVDGVAGARDRIVAHVDAHLADREFAPRSIAAALGMSVRYVHRAFADEDVSVSSYIRNRRLDALAAALRQDLRVVKLGPLAERFGFTSTDQLARGFRARFGATVREYRDRHRRRAL